MPPISSEASAIVTIPEPMSMLTDFCACASRQPDRAVNAFATQSPTVVVKTGSIELDLTISGLLPVARMARPSFVRRNSDRNTITSATAIRLTASFCCPARNVPSRAVCILVKTVSVLFIFNKDVLPMTAMLME